MTEPSAQRCWLRDVPWEAVIELNRALCSAGGYQHGLTREGRQTAAEAWADLSGTPLEFADLCMRLREFHRRAPFLFYNGNTFAAIARQLVSELRLSPDARYVVRQIAGHCVAGVATPEQEAELRRLLSP